MTKEQLELLLKYIDLRALRVAFLPDNTNFYHNLGYSYEEAEIRQDLIRSLEDNGLNRTKHEI